MEEPMMTAAQRDELKTLCQKADVPDKSGELLTREGAQHFIGSEEAIDRAKVTAEKPLEAFALAAFCYRVVEGAAGVLRAGAVFGAIGADGRVVEEPTVVPIPLFSAVRGPLHGAHINKSAKTAIAAISAIIPAPIPSRRVGSELVVRLRFWSSSSISSSSIAYSSNRPREERFLPQPPCC